jgi:hypothetical protein
MAVGDVHIAGPNGFALCDVGGPLRGYNATSQPCRDCEAVEWRQKHTPTYNSSQPEIASPRTFKVINGENGYGLSRDRDIVSDAFRAINWRRVDHGLAIVNVHLERINPRALRSAQHNIVIPNPEWWCAVGDISVEEMNAALVDPSVTVWAKTKDAECIFRDLGARVEYKGFTSLNRFDTSVFRERAFLHVAGEGPNKRTDRLLALWRPEWPTLTITCSKGLHSSGARPNIRVIADRLSDEELRAIQNRHTFHIYPSRYEGFGHAQWEGLSCGAIVFVCDGPPFDEHGDAFQLLASSLHGSPDWNSAVQWRNVQEAALEAGVAWTQTLTDEDLVARQLRARATWGASYRSFMERLHAAVTSIDQACR